ncbi:MAG: deoxyhypusine synthase [Thermoplasmata archaeon]|nr:deoxyhypusine synthase [Thermoplasmata archaeon]
MNRQDILSDVVKDISVRRGMSVDDLVSEMKASGGFTAKKLAEGIEILQRMIEDGDCLRFLSFPACIIATGTRGIIKDMLKLGWFDVVMTTCGTVDHDLARSWAEYYHGSFDMDDAYLHREGVNRLGNVLIPNESYGTILEERIQPVLEQMWDEGTRKISTKNLLWRFGSSLDDESSILYWAAKNRIPVYVPGITDGAFGYQMWSFWQEHKDLVIDVFQDEKELSDMVFEAKKTGALIVGGGISKHHTMWWNQFKGGLDYAVYVTTALEYDGSLSGARLREGISWGKVAEGASKVTIDGDATAFLPIMMACLLERAGSI